MFLKKKTRIFSHNLSPALFVLQGKKTQAFCPPSFAPEVQEFLRNAIQVQSLGERNAGIKAIAGGNDWRRALMILSRMTLERLNADWKLADLTCRCFFFFEISKLILACCCFLFLLFLKYVLAVVGR